MSHTLRGILIGSARCGCGSELTANQKELSDREGAWLVEPPPFGNILNKLLKYIPSKRGIYKGINFEWSKNLVISNLSGY